jgi:hypothetical protein
LPLDSAQSSAIPFLLETFGFYISLIPFANSASDSHQGPSLGGKLIYAGELDGHGRAVVVAGNIAGAATLAATADLVAQKQAIRDGVADFLVTSLDEALRILKNEIRKRETVAVCVGTAPDEIEREMLERGVLPDLRPRAASATEPEGFPGPGGLRVGLDPMGVQALVTWRVDSAPAQWLPKLDAIATDCLSPDAWAARRWLRLAPRYLGRLAREIRVLISDREFAASFVGQVREQVLQGGIGVPLQVQVSHPDGNEEYRFAPEGPLEAR